MEGSMNSSRAGNRRGTVSAFKLQAVQARPELNPELFEDGKYTYMVTAQGKQVYRSDSMEGVKFALQCRCGKPHVRFATLHSIEVEYDLFCQWCECVSSGQPAADTREAVNLSTLPPRSMYLL